MCGCKHYFDCRMWARYDNTSLAQGIVKYVQLEVQAQRRNSDGTHEGVAACDTWEVKHLAVPEQRDNNDCGVHCLATIKQIFIGRDPVAQPCTKFTATLCRSLMVQEIMSTTTLFDDDIARHNESQNLDAASLIHQPVHV